MRLVLAMLLVGTGCSDVEPVFRGRFTIEGDKAKRVMPVDAGRHIYPHDCLSLEPLDLFGVELFTHRGTLRFIHHPVDGPVMSFHPDEEDFTPWEARPGVCDVFRGELKRSTINSGEVSIEFEEVPAMRGRLELDCRPYDDDLYVVGEVRFDGCTDERKY